MKVKGSLLPALTPLLVWFLSGLVSERLLAVQDVAMMTLTAADNEKTIAGRVGDEGAVQLSENPTTGFMWMVDPSNDEHVIQIATEFMPARGGLLGASGQRRFVFRLERAGETRINMSLKRNWQENNATAANCFVITIRINENSVQ